MKRSNRLVLLIGIFLALVAFVLILFTLNGGSTPSGQQANPTTVNVVVAKKDIPLSAKITADAVETKEIAIADKPGNGFSDPAFVIGQTARKAVTAGQLITTDVLSGGGSISSIQVPAGFVGVPLLVDQVTGVGTLIKAGDFVDVVTGITGADKLPLVEGVTPRPVASARASASPGPAGYEPEALLYNPTTVKVLSEGLQVLGTLLPPPPAAANGQPATNPSTNLNTDQQEIVIVAATIQQAEVIKFAQMQGDISLVLRATTDCQTPDGQASPCPIIPTTGITLRVLVDDYGVLPPQIVQVIQPTPLPNVHPSGHPATVPSPSPSPSPSAVP